MFDGTSLMRLGAVNKFWHSIVSDEFVWSRINAARFGIEQTPPPAQPASALPGWSFFPGLDSPENDCASPEDAGADRSPAALARLADARGGVAFNTGGWVKRLVIPIWSWSRWTYEPGAGLWVRDAELARLRAQAEEHSSSGRGRGGGGGAPTAPAALPADAPPPQTRPPDFPGWLFYPLLDSPGNDIRSPRGGDSFRDVCSTLEELAARARATPGAVAFNTLGHVKSDLHAQSHWRRCTGPAGSSWAGLYVREEVVAARRLLRPLPGGGLDPRLRYFQRGKTRLQAARDVDVVWLNGEYLDRVPDPAEPLGPRGPLAMTGFGAAAGAAAAHAAGRMVVRLRHVCWLQLDGSFLGLGPGRYRALWSLRASSGAGYAPAVQTVNFTIMLSAKRPHRPLDVFRSGGGTEPGPPDGAEAAEGEGVEGVAGMLPVQQQLEQGPAGPAVGSELSTLRDVRLAVTPGAWRDVPAGEFEVPAGAIYDVGVRLWNFESGWKGGLLFKELRLVRLGPNGWEEAPGAPVPAPAPAPAPRAAAVAAAAGGSGSGSSGRHVVTAAAARMKGACVVM
ncbi:hypothetical protein HYH02_007407 [Chlamydomonas schloesseri]|uniref:F-box domain-containing protein n=1 Tax=Chlamydomonas schloesseri TaxID=2026947 RepID=A0A835WH29_9CHLO|nr:hypothetical protein HYH02_007407 [Chlamydomonas schloesseri]|eukprot:KAG2447479.1 hypothetical protein HYH02_007407 [Chlamydomonas schloesseri]